MDEFHGDYNNYDEFGDLSDEDDPELLRQKRELELELAGLSGDISGTSAGTTGSGLAFDDADFIITMDDDEDEEDWELEEEKRKLEAELFGMEYIPRERPPASQKKQRYDPEPEPEPYVPAQSSPTPIQTQSQLPQSAEARPAGQSGPRWRLA